MERTIKTNKALSNAFTVTSFLCLGFAAFLFVQFLMNNLDDLNLFRTVNIMLLLAGIAFQGLSRVIYNQNIIIEKLHQERKEGENV
ncbi:MAG: hypothetical protein FWB98_08260 [Defluviitaleaceae bacterium]|nr:hypothetical protein [Defluviitaleaceae bacterium]